MPENELSIDAKTTAFVVIDLQKGIASQQTMPHAASSVVANCAKIADKFRQAGAQVVLVRVAFVEDGSDRVQVQVDSTPFRSGALPADWSIIVPEMGPKEHDIVITKKQWGAFYGTELDLQLRRRGIKTIVIGGISTNFGVESTARDAFEHNYALIFVEDGMAGLKAEMHEFAVQNIFPRLGRVRTTQEVLSGW